MVADVTESTEKPAQHEGSLPNALPRSIHIGLPIASLLVLLGFALVIWQPANKAALPIQSTTAFIPFYIAMVIVMVFASMYIFKSMVDKDVSTTGH